MERRPVPFLFAVPVALGLAFLAGILGWGYAERRRPAGAPVAAVRPAPRETVVSRGSDRPRSGTSPAEAVTVPANPKPASPALAADKPETYLWPVIAPISSPFGPRWGRFHGGIDLAANMGEPIKAARSGEVVLAGAYQDYGLAIILRHADGTKTLYGHCSVLKVKAGQQVKQGDVIGLVGSTGLSTGPHLHFEVRVNDQARDPLMYLPPNQYVHR